MDLRLNESNINIPTTAATWGDVLDWLETEYLHAGQCITRVMLDGSEELNYRNPRICNRPLESVREIDVESGEFDKVVRETMEELGTEIDAAIQSVQEVVRLFESHEVEPAYRQLARLLESIKIFYAVFSEELGWVYLEGDKGRQGWSQAIEATLVQLVAAQENGQWVSICDVLEYELSPILENWKAIVQRTREGLN